MTRLDADETVERERLIFGAGFAFGVMFTLLILGIVFSTVASQTVTLSTLLDSQVLLPVAAAIVFAFVVGVGLYLLALPTQGFGIPRPVVDPETPDAESADTEN